MSRQWYRHALTQLATIAGISLATQLKADDSYGLPPIVTAGAHQEQTAFEDQRIGPAHYAEDQVADSNVRTVVQVTNIPSVFDSQLSSVQRASCAEDGACGSVGAYGPNSCESGCVTDCCVPWWAHRSGGFGELLYLSAGSSDLIYATEQTGPGGGASPTGPIGISNIDEHLGYRFGLSYALSNCGSLVGSYTRWDGETTSILQATGTNVINSNVIHPSTATTGAASLEATATQIANFQFADLVLRRVYRASDCGVINWNAGARYGNLEQGLSADQTVSVGTGLTNVTTDIDFNGLGIIGGLDGERHSARSGLLLYGRAMGSLLAGNWQADYRQTNQFGGGVIANRYDDYRVTPVVDTELGVGWQNCDGCFRVTTGYLFSTWFNAVTNRDYIQSVRSGNLLNMDDNLTFSGLTLRTELRF